MDIEQKGRAVAVSRRRAASRLTIAQLRRLGVVLGLAAGCLVAQKALAHETVGFQADVAPGTIVIRTGERRLYLVERDGTALRYPVAVGKPGKQWFGWAHVDGKYVEPAWSPPARREARQSEGMPDVIPGGSPHNPMGDAGAHPGSRRNRHSRYQPAEFRWHLGILRLYSDVQSRHRRPVRSRSRRHARSSSSASSQAAFRRSRKSPMRSSARAMFSAELA